MSMRVDVLCPSGHTLTVKTSPNDPVVAILTEACQRRNLDRSTHYLRRAGGVSRNRLDNSLPVRLANLNNRAKLELIEMSGEEKEKQKSEADK